MAIESSGYPLFRGHCQRLESTPNAKAQETPKAEWRTGPSVSLIYKHCTCIDDLSPVASSSFNPGLPLSLPLLVPSVWRLRASRAGFAIELFYRRVRDREGRPMDARARPITSRCRGLEYGTNHLRVVSCDRRLDTFECRVAVALGEPLR